MPCAVHLYSPRVCILFDPVPDFVKEGSVAVMSAKEENRIFVGGLSRDTSERRLEAEFSRFGKVVEAKV
ncbi:hypothetical protein ZIOFF_031391 [Zingiber officinale]|uniref:RRM domain-containing protein n=2 Tax=Zingiber officinale TaxID=94328 RepID=A0A8J5LAR0_ZINOF|nr:hypothetical protein ZIOFF_031391 [Zingiber officinale]